MKKAVACAAAILVIARIGEGQTGDAPRLPEPSGVFGVGRAAFHWIDTKRPEPFSSSPGPRRELMVYVWYPAAPEHKFDSGVYLPGAKQVDSARGFDRARAGPAWPLIVSGAIKSHAREGAPFAPGTDRFPLILFSPGNGTSSFSYTTAIEHLVSHGYAMTESDKSSPFYRRVDWRRIGAVGHSLGGMTAVRACQRDLRIRACVNQDGGTVDGVFLQYPGAPPLTQPFLFIEATRLSTFTTATDQQLADRGLTRAVWTRRLTESLPPGNDNSRAASAEPTMSNCLRPG
jgi:Platelet-activating factor acetylhydrolase, isoform II